MKKISNENLSNIIGGSRTVINGIGWGCVAVGLAGVAAGIFTFGAGTVFAITLGGAFCTGASIGSLAWNINH
jgi:bacteriocin-like protein